ncbi:hypothetical protein TSUD_34840 [Trifolium subterraneum]|uniref:Uncharacterized protein n=1 Tax=Trifolium subterraneum TaxID=3900 RepID=A0A2Z6LR10_TRISU|nr:hypothetical protein TSUD_34840 [Trifolium subterraneum]
MELQNSTKKPNPEEPSNFNNGETEDIDSNCSTPYVSAPSSPGRGGGGTVTSGYFYSAPASPLHFAITASSSSYHHQTTTNSNVVPLSYEFEFSARFGSTGSASSGSMTSADELFLNGQIRPMKLSSHLERPQVLAPLLDLEEEDEEDDEDSDCVVVRGRDLRLRDKSVRRRTRSMSPLRNNTHLEWTENEEEDEEPKDNKDVIVSGIENENNDNGTEMENVKVKVDEMGLERIEIITTPSDSASSSRSSSAGRSSKRWVFLKDFLRSKSEGRSNNKFWSTISFSPIKDKKSNSNNQNLQPQITKEKSCNSQRNGSSSSHHGWSKKKPMNGIGKRRVPPSPHELHYKANRAQAEELRKKTFLPYRQGLLGCLGFSSKGYGAMNGFARALNPVSSR